MVDGLWLFDADYRPGAVTFYKLPVTAKSGGIRIRAWQAHYNALTGGTQASYVLTQCVSV